MVDTVFVDYSPSTPIVATWLNDVNKTVYQALGTGGVAPTTADEVLVNLDLSKTVASYAALRALTTAGITRAFVNGCAHIFDGGFGIFQVDSTDTTSADNGVTILVDAIGRRWKREFSGPINAIWSEGIDPTGTTDSLAAFEAVNACFGAGDFGAVFVPEGTYNLSGTLNISQPIQFIGEGSNTVTINLTFATGPGIKFYAATWYWDVVTKLDGFSFTSSVTRTADAYVETHTAGYVNIENCRFIGGYNGFHLTGPTSTSIHVKNCIFSTQSNDSILIDAATGTQGSVDLIFENLWIHGASPTSQLANGINIISAGDITLRHISTVYGGNGLRIAPLTGNVVQALICEESFFDSGDGYGIEIDTTGGGTVQLAKLTDVWSATNSLGGLILTGASGAILQTDVLGCTISNNGVNGILLGTSVVLNTTITGCSISANSADGINVAGAVTNFRIVDNTIGPSGQFAANGQWGVYIGLGVSDDYIVANNTIKGNTSGELYDGGTGVSKILYPNIGVPAAITPNAVPSVDWGIDFAKSGYYPITASSTYDLAAGSGLVILHNNNTGDMGLYMCYGGTVTLVAGAASMVSGAAGANQIGFAYNAGGFYQVSNGYGTTQNIYITSIKTRTQT